MGIVNNILPGDPFFAGDPMIVNQMQGTILNTGGVALNLGKLRQLPPYEEVEGYREHWRHDDSELTRVFDMPWFSRSAFKNEMLGYPVAVQIAGNPLLFRNPPAQDPEYPWLYADEVEQVQEAAGVLGNNPFVLPAQKVAYYDVSAQSLNASLVNQGRCRFAVTYRARPYDVRTDGQTLALAAAMPTVPMELQRFVERSNTYAVQALPVARPGELKFAEGPASNPQILGEVIPEAAATIILYTAEYTYTWYHVPDVPEQAFKDCAGKINQETFDGAKGATSFRAGTLCQAPVKRRARSVAGRVLWDITYKMLWRDNGTDSFGNAQGWNHFPAADGKFYLATVGGGASGERLYKTANFNSLFKPPTPVFYDDP